MTSVTKRSIYKIAIAEGLQEVVQLLLENKANPNGYYRTSPLLAASKGGNFAIAKLLLNHGADPNRINTKDSSDLLVEAAAQGDMAIVKLLIDYGANVFASRNEFGDDVLSVAVETGIQELVKLLLDNGANALTSRDRDGKDVLFIASRLSRPDIVKLILDHGGGENLGNKDHFDALFEASRGDKSIVEMLLKRCADFYPPDNRQYRHPLQLASERGTCNHEVVKLLLEQRSRSHIDDIVLEDVLDEYPSTSSAIARTVFRHMAKFCADSPICVSDTLFQALRDRRCGIVAFLLSEGADPNATEEQNGVIRHILASAIYSGNYSIADVLLHHGANVNAVDSDGRTALYNAALGYNYLILNKLIARGARIDVGRNILEYCIQHDRIGLKAKLIVENGLYEASKRGSLSEIKFILEYATGFTELQGHLKNCLMIASDRGHSEVFVMLQESLRYPSLQVDRSLCEALRLDSEIDVHANGYQNYSVLRHAASNSHQEIAEVLLSKEADADDLHIIMDNSRVKDGSTANKSKSGTPTEPFILTGDGLWVPFEYEDWVSEEV